MLRPPAPADGLRPVTPRRPGSGPGGTHRIIVRLVRCLGGGRPRPERAELVNLETGDSVVVALFAGRRGAPVRLSNAAAEAIGVGAAPVRVRVTALRSRPTLDTTLGRF